MVIKREFWEEAINDINILKQWLADAYDSGLLQEDIVAPKDMELLKIFIMDERKVFNYLLKESRSKSESYFDLVNKTQDRNIVVFGCSMIGRFVHALFENKVRGKVVAFCDNNTALHEGCIQGVKVISPEKAVETYPEAAFIITGTKSAEAMKVQLKQIAKGNICFFEYTPEIEMRLFLM